ncbi:MAG: hypothetical protein ACEQSX_14035, partial [Baekduiaceae bacterium]
MRVDQPGQQRLALAGDDGLALRGLERAALGDRVDLPLEDAAGRAAVREALPLQPDLLSIGE